MSQKKPRTIWFHACVKCKTETHRHRQSMVATRGKGAKKVAQGKVRQIYGDGRWFDFECWAHNAMYILCIIEIYTRNVFNLIKQCHPNTFNLKIKKN